MDQNQTYSSLLYTHPRVSVTTDYIVGFCFLFITFLGAVGYALVLPAIALSKKNLRHPCYGIIFSLGVSDSISLVGWLVIGLDTATHGALFPTSLVKHSLCVLVVGWGSLTAHMAVLSVNRYIAVCKGNLHDAMFSKPRLWLMLIGCWTYALFIHALPTFLPPHMNYTLQGYTATWENPKVTAYYYMEDLSLCSLVFLLDITCYAAIIMRYRQIKQQFANLPCATVDARVRQFRIAMQCMIRCFVFYSYDVLYYTIGLMTDNMWITFICSTYLWAVNNALSPCIYLTFDQQLRSTVAGWCRCNTASVCHELRCVRVKIMNKRVQPSGNAAATQSHRHS